MAVRLLLVLLVVLAQASAQNPSPMSDSTRPHTRVERYEVPGRRAALSLGTLYVPPSFDPARPFLLIVHFHGAPWLVEHHVRERQPQAALITVQIGAGSRVYAEAFGDPARFATLLAEVSAKLAELIGRPASWDSIALSSFSAGYGAIRSILSRPEDIERVNAVILADSLHASYLRVVEAALRLDLNSGHYARGIEVAQLAAEAEPESEEIQLAVMRLFRLSGSYAAAAEQYGHYAQTLREIGIEPQPLSSL